MEIMAPKKAATIIPQDPTPIPRLRKRSITRDTASLAPEDIPSTKGLAIGFPKKVWRRKPDTDRAPPSMAAAKASEGEYPTKSVLRESLLPFR